MATPQSIAQLLGERPLLVMYRDCLKAVPLMNSNSVSPSLQQAAQANIQLHFRMEFEKMRRAQNEAEVNAFKEGIVRLLSNFTIYTIKQQYIDNKEMFDNSNYSIHDEDDVAEAEQTATPTDEDQEEQDPDQTKEEAAAKFPLF